MLRREEEQYLMEMEQKEETTIERQAKMRERARALKDRREAERLQFVQEKYDQQFRLVALLVAFVFMIQTLKKTNGACLCHVHPSVY